MVVILDIEGIYGKSFLVTGGSSALGQALCLELHHRGAKCVKCFDWNIKKKGSTSFPGSTITSLHGDVRSRSSVFNALHDIDTVFHVASFGNSWSQMLQKQKMYDINVSGTSNVLHACIDSGVKRLIYTNDCPFEFGDAAPIPDHIDTDQFRKLSNIVAFWETKALAEKLVLGFNGRPLNTSPREYLFTCVVRPAFVYQSSQCIPTLNPFRDARMLLSYHIVHDRPDKESNKLDWVSMENAVHAHLLICKGLMPPDSSKSRKPRLIPSEEFPKPVAAGKTYFITDGPPMSFFEFFLPLIQARRQSLALFYISFHSILFSMLKINTAIKWFHSKLGQSWLPQPWILASDKSKGSLVRIPPLQAEKEIGYEPLVSREETLQDLRSNTPSKNVDRNQPSATTWILVCTGLTLLFLSAFVPPPLMGPLEFVREAGIIVFMSQENLVLLWWLSMLIHLFEASVAWLIASQIDPPNASKWFFQTMVLGFFSLRFLLRKLSE